jgi:hypothetical protein
MSRDGKAIAGFFEPFRASTPQRAPGTTEERPEMSRKSPTILDLQDHTLVSLLAAESAATLASLQCASTRFWRRSGSLVASVTDEAARLACAQYSPAEIACAPRRGDEPWLGILRELEALRGPRNWTECAPGVNVALLPCADKSFGGPWPGRPQDTHYSMADADPNDETTNTGYHPVVCGGAVMRAGRHYVEMNNPGCMQEALWMGGIVPAEYDPSTLAASMEGAHNVAGSYFIGMWYPAYSGCFANGERHVPELLHGMNNAQPHDEVLGLLLDLDEGSLAVYRKKAFHSFTHTDRPAGAYVLDDEGDGIDGLERDGGEQYGRLGYFAKPGSIQGPVVWAAQMHNNGHPVAGMGAPGEDYSHGMCNVRILAQHVPTIAEVKAEIEAKRARWQRHQDGDRTEGSEDDY